MAQACIVKFGYHTSKNPKGGNIKQFKRMLLGVFAAAFVAVAWGDSAPPSFDIRELSDEQRRALINSLLPHQLDPWLEQFQGEDTIIFSVDTTRSNEEDPGTENTVGHYYCDLNVHYPHVGASSGTVKAKAYASCSLTQTGDPFPPAGAVEWELLLSLYRERLWGLWPVPVLVGSETYSKTGYDVTWPPNNTSQSPGTQVDSGQCVDGSYMATVAITLIIPAPWVVLPSPIVKTGYTPYVTINGCNTLGG